LGKNQRFPGQYSRRSRFGKPSIQNAGLAHKHPDLAGPNQHETSGKPDHPSIQIGLATLITGIGFLVLIGSIELALRRPGPAWQVLAVVLLCGDFASFIFGWFLSLWRALCALSE
jgi:hypothetical protein